MRNCIFKKFNNKKITPITAIQLIYAIMYVNFVQYCITKHKKIFPDIK